MERSARDNVLYVGKLCIIAEWNEVKTFTPVIEENALCIYKDRQRPVLVKGVPDNYTELSHIQDIVTSGTFQLNDGRIDYVSLGIGVAGQLGVVANSPYPVELYAPNRLGKVNLANPSQSFNGRRIFVSSTFCTNQAIYDSQDESRTSSDSRNEPPFDEEDFRNESVVGSEVL